MHALDDLRRMTFQKYRAGTKNGFGLFFLVYYFLHPLFFLGGDFLYVCRFCMYISLRHGWCF